MWAIFLGFLGAFIIWFFDIKANMYQRKKKEKKKEKTTEKEDKQTHFNLFRFLEGLAILIVLTIAIYQALTK